MSPFAVVVAVVLDREAERRPGQVHPGHEASARAYLVLGGERAEAGVEQEQPQASLHRGLAQRLGQRQHLAQQRSARPARPGGGIGPQGGQLHDPATQQRLDGDQRLGE
ncbi:hypothetical protein M3G91_02220 [Micromonospora chalcea]|uniref:hypothetical protein n=1 Tax=Micromonospora chalcea TaxID=1874 RepID=UPI0021A4A692|nr:hypothetical protein [Micromonospora chalcea]MCT2276426.1 hypothetical protein [Micromonospora chalcea]